MRTENMTQQNAIQIFEGNQVRVAWNEEEEKYYFSIVDVVQILTEQPTPRKASTYWAVLKKRLKEEGADELLTNCKQLKMPAADGKNRATDVADLEQMLRIIQSIPSKKAEPIKQWLSEMADYLSVNRSAVRKQVEGFRKKGYPDRRDDGSWHVLALNSNIKKA